MSRKCLVSRREFLGAAAAAVGTAAVSAAPASSGKRLVMLAGGPSHGPMEHEFHAGSMLLQKCLAGTPGLTVDVVTNGWPKDESVLDGADAILSYADGGTGHPLVRGNHLEVVGRLMHKGVGLMCAHYGVEVPRDLAGKQFQDWIGGYYEDHYSCNPMWEPEFKEFPDHPIARGVRPFSVRDEWYFNMRFRPDMKGVTPILAAKPSDKVRQGPYVHPKGPYEHIVAASGRPEAMMWALERPDGGRGVGFTGGHFHKNWLEPNFRKVVLNALLWVSKMEVPAGGVESTLTEADIAQNLDPKPRKK
jgi:hypothetical protein